MRRKWEVVILGGGFAGLACARRLEKLWGASASQRVLLVSAENYFLFQPFLPEVVAASVEPRHVVNPVRFVLRRCEVRRATASRLDLDRRLVEFEAQEAPAPEPVEADHLVLALGTGTNLRAVPGMMEHGLFLKTLADALALREHIVGRLEQANLEPDEPVRDALLHFVVVGGGYSGVETAGQVLDLLEEARRFYPSLSSSRLRVTLVHSGPHWLPELGERLGAFAKRALERRGMGILLGRRVTAVGGTYVLLGDATRLESQNVVCTIGNAPHPLLSDLRVEYRHGRIVTDPRLRVTGYEGVWAIGDAAANPDGHGGWCPPTAQFASRLGRAAAENVAASRSGRPSRDFRYKSLGQMATIGHHKGVCQIGGFRFKGLFAWWLTRTVHLFKLPRLDRKLRVVIDWTFELFFPPDLNYFDLRKTQKLARIHVQPGEVVFRQGDRGSALYLVEDGSLEAVRYDDRGQVLWRDELHPGDHFGEGSFLYGLPRRATVTARTPARLMVFATKIFKEFIGGFEVLSRLLRHTALRGPQEEALEEGKWSAELLASPVAAVMGGPPPSLADTATIGEAVVKAAESRGAPVMLVGPEGRLSGLVTKTDLYGALTHGRGLREAVSTVGNRRIVSVSSNQTVREALGVLYREDVKQAPVVDAGGRPVGALGYVEVAAARARMEDDKPLP